MLREEAEVLAAEHAKEILLTVLTNTNTSAIRECGEDVAAFYEATYKGILNVLLAESLDG